MSSSQTAYSPTQSNRAKKMLRAGELVKLFVMGNFATPRTVDFVCRSGLFDALWFDLEHFDIPTQELAVLNLVARACPVTTIARFKATDYQTVSRVLETGVGGIMCSMVANADEARQIVNWAKFNNPRPLPGEVTGSRCWNGGNIDAAYGAIPPADYARQQNNETLVICQIETEAAVAEARAIADVPGVDGLFFGPGDFSTSLGLLGQIRHERVRAAMQAVGKAAAEAGKWWGTLGVGQEMFADVKAMGARLICPGGDLKVMHLGIRELAKTFDAPAPKL